MVRSIGFVGIRTDRYPETVALYRDLLGMRPTLERPGATWFQASNGTAIHVYGPDDADHDFFGAGPVVGYVVEDFSATREAMVAAGIEFIGEVQRDGRTAWNHFRGPDGNVHELMGPDRDGS